jgi:ubiquinol-cytochrome c reductase cytochrome c subunit
MPAFGTAALTKEQVDDVVRYVGYLHDPDDRGGLPLRHLGPVAEGAIGLVALALVLCLCRWIGDRA